MTRAAAIALVLAVVALAASGLVWLWETSAGQVAEGEREPVTLMTAFERSTRPRAEIALADRYAGRLELVDPSMVLPRWHRLPRAEAAAVFAATRDCTAHEVPTPNDPVLAKVLAWQVAACHGATMPEGPPLMHPSGRSFAAMALARDPAAHVDPRAVHVLELASLPADRLDADGLALRALDAFAWDAIAHGDRIVLGTSSLVLVDRGRDGAERLRLYDRSAWERATRAAAIRLVSSGGHACARPASSALCWVDVSSLERQRGMLVAITVASAAAALFAGVAIAIAAVRERRRVHADRIHVLRTLTHELRTPATSLGIDIEPLRGAYDAMPADCQEPLLRVSDGIARLNRILDRSARYMALFETNARAPLVLRRHVASAREMMLAMAEEWPDDVVLDGPVDDRSVTTDPEWLGVAVRNLVENAVRHGKPPAHVTWVFDGAMLVVRVSDAGTSIGVSLRNVIAPYHRDPASPGLGLGLAIVDRVARLLGGTLVHEASPTVFQLRVPA